MVADPKDKGRKDTEKNLEQEENAAGKSEELREEQLKDVAGGIDYLSWKSRTPQVDEGGE